MRNATASLMTICLLYLAVFHIDCRSADSDSKATTKPSVSGLYVQIEDVLTAGKGNMDFMTMCPGTRRLFLAFSSSPELLEFDADTLGYVRSYSFGEEFHVYRIFVAPDGKVALVCLRSRDKIHHKIVLFDLIQNRISRNLDRDEQVFEARYSTDSQAVMLRTSGFDLWPPVISIYGKSIDESTKYDLREDSIRERKTAPAVWYNELSKETSGNETYGLYCRDNKGGTHRLDKTTSICCYCLTQGDLHVAMLTRQGELAVWRRDSGAEVLRQKVFDDCGYLVHDSQMNQLLVGGRIAGKTLICRVPLPNDPGSSRTSN
jgi:hypothetical protein